MRWWRWALGATLALGLCSSGARAQTADGPPTTKPAPPPPAEPACVPRCRSGFVCYRGQCIYACNPPCQEGEQCTSSGECIRKRGGGGTKPPPPPLPEEEKGYGAGGTRSGSGSAPPPSAWGEQRDQRPPSQPGSQPPPAWGEPRPTEPITVDPGRGFRAALWGPLLGLGGEADTGSSGVYDLSPTYGFGGMLEGNIPYFGFGGGFRVVFWTFPNVDRYRGLDFFFSPRLRIPFGDAAGEFYLASPIGFSVDRADDPVSGRSVGGGWNFAVRTGVQVFLTEHFGVLFGLGGLFRGIVVGGATFDTVRTRQFMLEFGISFMD